MNTKIDRFELMQLFIRVVETRSVSAAGRLLGLSQPSASRQLKQLEILLGAQLVQRSTHELMLTDAGEKFFVAATEMLARWESAADSAAADRDEFHGPIRVAVPVAIGPTILADMAARFLLENPGITFDWRIVDEPGDLAAGGYDVWIRAGAIADETLIVHQLRQGERTVVARADHPRVDHPNDLSRRNAVRLATYVSPSLTLETNDGRSAVVKMTPVFTTDNIYAALAAVTRGVGYAVLPYWLIQDELETGSLIELCPCWKPTGILLCIAYPQSKFRPARVRLFIDYIRRQFAASDGRDLTATHLRPSFAGELPSARK